MKFHLTLVKVEIEVEVSGCVEHILRLKNLGQPFLILRRKLDRAILQGSFILFHHEKNKGNGYPQRIFMSGHLP